MDLVISLQRARLMAVLRGMSRTAAENDTDALLLIGLAVGLELARTQPETAAQMLVELDPPIELIDSWLDWVVSGDKEPNPDEPIN